MMSRSFGSITVSPRDTVDLQRLLPTVGRVDRYWEILDEWRSAIEKPHVKAVLDLFFQGLGAIDVASWIGFAKRAKIAVRCLNGTKAGN